MLYAGILVPGMSVEKQLEAAQKFLRGIRSLTSYAEVRDKQASGFLKALEKVEFFTAAQAAALLAQVQPDLWAESQVDSFREKVALKTRSIESDQARAVTQDFSLLPYYLTDELAAAIGEVDGDVERRLPKECLRGNQGHIGRDGSLGFMQAWSLFSKAAAWIVSAVQAGCD